MSGLSIDMKATSDNMRSLMQKNNVSTRELSNRLGISFQAVHKYIHGLTLPSILHLYMIAKMLGTTMDKLIVVRKDC